MREATVLKLPYTLPWKMISVRQLPGERDAAEDLPVDFLISGYLLCNLSATTITETAWIDNVQIASRAMWMFLKPPKTCIVWSAKTTLVLLAFSIANLVLPRVAVSVYWAEDKPVLGLYLLFQLYAQSRDSCVRR